MQSQMNSLLRARTRVKNPFVVATVILVSLALGLLVQGFINSLTDRQLIFCLIPPVMLVAWVSGFRSGVVACLAAILSADFFLFEPFLAFDLGNEYDMVTLAAFASITLPGAWLFSALSTKTNLLQLAQSELEMTLKSIGDAVLVVDHKQKVAFLNPVAERLTGWKLEEARNRDVGEVFKIINEKTREPAINPIEKVLAEGRVVGLANHTILISKVGSEYQIEDSAAPIRLHPSDEVVGVVLVFRDVTSKYESERKTSETLKTLETVLTELSDGVVFTDGSGGNFKMNKVALDLHGFKSNAEMFERFEKYKQIFAIRTLNGQLIPEDQWPLSRVLRGERFHNFEATVQRTDNGLSFVASYSGTPITDEHGNIKLAVITVRDISKRAEAQMEMQRAKEEAEQASTLKTAFLANMSHEIRTPMTAVLGFTEVLRNSSLTEAERQDAITRIDNSGRALLKLIDDILDVSKVEAGKIDIQKARFSPIEVVSEVISLLRIQADQKGIDLRLKVASDFPEIAHSDSMRVRQVITNLIGNALKFTQEGHIEVCLKRDQENLVFEVHDTGIGISEQDQKRLFQPFAQADGSITRRFGGTGLGLVLSKDIAEALGGSLKLDRSVKGKGSTFITRIPGSPFETSKIQESQQDFSKTTQSYLPVDKALVGLNVLVAEDVADNQALLRIYLTGAGAQRIEFASNGEEAVAKAMARPYDLVLMDIQMPGMDGIQATKRLRELGYARPIVALTAHAMPEEVQRTLAAGCDGHIAKPINKEGLIRAVAAYAGKSDRVT